MEWATEPLRMRYACLVDRKLFSTAQSIELSKIAHIFSAIVWHEATFTDTMQRLQSYVPALKEGNYARYVNVRTTESVEDGMFSKFLAAISRTTAIPYIKVREMMV